MSAAPPSTPVDPEIGPGRFQRVATTPQRRRVAAPLGAAALLLMLVVGVPAGLLWLAGVPAVPTSLPARDVLTSTIGAEQLLSALVWVVWLAWLQFAICVVVELTSALSGIGLPTRVPLAGPSQRFARTLVVTVLLLATAAGQASAAVGTMLPERVAAAAPELDTVEVPVLTHFDLWAGNVFVARSAGTARLEALIDGERAFWGDPLAELASTALFANPAKDFDFLDGYAQAAGEPLVLDDRARLRLTLYRTYLYLIMTVEAAPRGYSGAEAVATAVYVRKKLKRELKTLRASLV